MVYKHRTQSGKVRHYQSRGHYLNSVRGMFANNYQKKNHSRKIAKSKAKSKMKHRVVGRVSSGKTLCKMCRGKHHNLDKGVCKKCKELTKEFEKEEKKKPKHPQKRWKDNQRIGNTVYRFVATAQSHEEAETIKQSVENQWRELGMPHDVTILQSHRPQGIPVRHETSPVQSGRKGDFAIYHASIST